MIYDFIFKCFKIFGMELILTDTRFILQIMLLIDESAKLLLILVQNGYLMTASIERHQQRTSTLPRKDVAIFLGVWRWWCGRE